jgi:hypothetical protein
VHDGVAGPILGPGGKLTKAQKKKLAKQRKQAEREQKQRAMTDKEKAVKAKRDKQDAEMQRRQDERDAKAQEAADKAAALQAAEAAEAQEELDDWVDSFEIAQSGSNTLDVASESQGLLGEFIDYIETRKVVNVDELATHFKLRSAECVARLKALEQSGAITGILDERGKFISMTDTELQGVADFIKRRGRVSISELVAESNQLIDLQGTHVEEGTNLDDVEIDDDDDDDGDVKGEEEKKE